YKETDEMGNLSISKHVQKKIVGVTTIPAILTDDSTRMARRDRSRNAERDSGSGDEGSVYV
ncbi:MAG: hypothetical protein Q4C36_09200, partial [Coriobacteriia bacterium]|nr:hypothetical protein [Coriobacteriia bacterium]